MYRLQIKNKIDIEDKAIKEEIKDEIKAEIRSEENKPKEEIVVMVD